MKRIARGVYEQDGELHIDVPELLRANGFADTEENRDLLVRAAKKRAELMGIPWSVCVEGKEVEHGASRR